MVYINWFWNSKIYHDKTVKPILHWRCSVGMEDAGGLKEGSNSGALTSFVMKFHECKKCKIYGQNVFAS